MKIKSEYFVFMFIVCILFSITAVSANDNQTDSLNLDMISDDELMQTTNRPFNDFYEDIKDCNDTFDIKNDYVYDESDNNTRLAINQRNLIINGNNHIIDGSNMAKGFVFMKGNTNVTINDLTFINCNQSVVLSSGNVTLKNVNFTGNFNLDSMMGIVTINYAGNLIMDKCNFNSNINTSLILIGYGDVAIYNSHFYNTNAGEISPIFVNRKSLVIENCTFENLSSKYGGAINFRGYYFSIKNSTFRDVNAYLTGGAVVAKYFPILAGTDAHNNPIYRPSENWLIENSEFLNVSSSHNGGVLYIHLVLENPTLPKKTLYINNCNFTDSSSRFGGAIGHLDGALDISNTSFINSRASDMAVQFALPGRI